MIELLLNPIGLIILALATFRITRVIIEDDIATPIRDVVWRRFPPESTKLGYVFTCYWCMSVWVASLTTTAYILGGWIALAVLLVFAVSALVGIIQSLLER